MLKRAKELYTKYGVSGISRRVAQKARRILPQANSLKVRQRFISRLQSDPDDVYRFAFAPEVPNDNYLVSSVCKVLNASKETYVPGSNYDAVLHWNDTTNLDDEFPDRLNGKCISIGKDHVAQSFERVSGYGLRIDPTTHNGPAVMKSDANGMHDGKVVICPTSAVDGYVFQKLIDNTIRDSVEDLRATIVGGEVATVVRKRRYTYERFANTNHDIALLEPNEVFTEAEQSMLILRWRLIWV